MLNARTKDSSNFKKIRVAPSSVILTSLSPLKNEKPNATSL